MKEDKQSARRKFLKKTGMAVGLIAGASLLAPIKAQTAKGKKITLLASNASYPSVENGEKPAGKQAAAEIEAELQRRGREGLPGRKFVMVIDLAKCKNAQKCVAACDSAHQLVNSGHHHLNVLNMQESDDTAPFYMPKPCMHCDNPPCTKVCPVDATFKRQDGIVLIDNDRCIGCRFCIAACPYSVRIFNWLEPVDADKYADQPYDVELNVPQKRGTVSKCVFSADRLRENKLPYCVTACPNGVYWFGDKNEDAVTNGTSGETVCFSELMEENAGYSLLPELGTKPQVFYLPPKERIMKFEGEITDKH